MNTWYENIKNLYQKYKQTLILLASFVLVFIGGFGTGRAHQIIIDQKSVKPNQQNYTTSAPKTPKTETNQLIPDDQKPLTTETSPPQAAALTNEKADCPIKGNIGAGGTKTYHIKGGAFYERTNPEQCFNTEDEALAAGFKKSSR